MEQGGDAERFEFVGGEIHSTADGDGNARDAFAVAARVFVLAIDSCGEGLYRADEEFAVLLRGLGEIRDLVLDLAAHEIERLSERTDLSYILCINTARIVALSDLFCGGNKPHDRRG